MTENPDFDKSRGRTTVPGPGPPLSLDTVLEVLADRTRRFALYSLADTVDGVTDVETLVEEVATLEAARRDAAVRRDRYLELATDRYHWQLPVLAEVGIVDSDGSGETIRYRRDPTVGAWLARVRRGELDREDTSNPGVSFPPDGRA